MKKEIIKTEGMHCPSCVALLESEIEDLNGVLSVTASLENAEVEVEYDETLLDIMQIKNIITENGFKVI